MDDNSQVVAVGFVLIIAVGAALAFGGIIDFPSVESAPGPVEVIGIELQDSLFSPAPVELEIPGFQEEPNLAQYIYDASIMTQSITQSQIETDFQSPAHAVGACQKGY